MGHAGPALSWEERIDPVKKNKNEERKPHRLTLSRETIQTLSNPALLELARGGDAGATGSQCTNCTTTSTGVYSDPC